MCSYVVLGDSNSYNSGVAVSNLNRVMPMRCILKEVPGEQRTVFFEEPGIVIHS
jgi:hypothetical protein